MWRRAGEELITHRQAGEQQTDAMRARLSSAQPEWRETQGRKEEWEKERRGYFLKKWRKCELLEWDKEKEKRKDRKRKRKMKKFICEKCVA